MLLKLADQFKQMNAPESTHSGGHAMYLTSDTSNELNMTLTGFGSLAKLLLNHGFS